jgi:hypothetical protein
VISENGGFFALVAKFVHGNKKATKRQSEIIAMSRRDEKLKVMVDWLCQGKNRMGALKGADSPQKTALQTAKMGINMRSDPLK